jgi:replicative DNA helicase
MTTTTPAPAGAPAVPSFDFGPEFETKIAALFLTDDRFNRESVDFLQPAYFNNVVERNLVTLSQEFTRSYNTTASATTLVDLIKSDKRIDPTEHVAYVKKIVELHKVDLKEREYIRARAVDFSKKQAMTLALLEGVEALKKGNFDKVKAGIDKAHGIGSESQAQFIDFFAEFEKRKARREAVALGLIVPGVTTGFPEIDAQLYRKGWGRGELSLIMAPSKRGKTALMLQSALNSSMGFGVRVLYISLEVSEDILEDRADAAATSTIMDALIDQREAVARAIATLSGGLGKLYIERRPSASMTTDQVDSLIETYFTTGRPIDVVIVDYVGIMRIKPSDDRFVGLGNAGKELRRIAGKYNVAMISGAQTNRDALSKQIAGQDSMGECYVLVQDCDLLLSINANDAELAAGVRRIFVAASRNSAEVTIKVKGDLSKMQIIQEVLAVEH